ncbi:hypothetical protein P4V41_20700 [Fictibacillus nanhaiensis]|uniref:hypothetical protein n=1 Tax=Fictibacillus nanhaiensis TaxID=742169 RepID=UPI002E21BFBA|nr:hypothetical protein [Fictibacillus nanhaiensis]
MDKNTFSNKINEVEVPKEDVIQAIKSGVMENTNSEGNVSFNVDSIIYGKASTAIIYRVTYPKGELDSFIRMLDVQGVDESFKTDGYLSDGKIDKFTDGNRTTEVRRIVFTQLLKNKTLSVSPSYNETLSPVLPLELKLP